MTLRRLETPEDVGASRGDVVVCIPVFGAPPIVRESIESVARHTPAEVTVLVLDDASPNDAVERVLEAVAENWPALDLVYARQPANVGFVENANTAFAMAAPADVVLLNSDCVVAAEWLERLRDAALSDTLIATASALTNHGTIVSVPRRNRPASSFPGGVEIEDAAAAVREGSKRLRPRIPTALGHCVYVRRSALDLVGGFDPVFSPGYGEEVDFSQRCIEQGLCHVAADDVLVFHDARSSFGERASALRDEHDRIVRSRYPFYDAAVESTAAASTTPLARSLAIARRTMKPLSVTIDGRVLGPQLTGTQLHVVELVAALWRTREIDLRLIVPPNVGAYAQDLLGDLEGLELVLPHAVKRLARSDVAHRPYQVFDSDDLSMLVRLGERVVLTHQDLISYRNPSYFDDPIRWLAYQQLTRQALAVADRVVFFSDHAAQDALKEDLVDPDRVRVVYVGTDHRVRLGREPRPPAAFAAEPPFLLCLGTNFRHKNRLFALRVLEELRAGGWHGRLVFAGPHAASGTSAAQEAAFLAERPELRSHVLDLEAVDEEEKAWLLERAALVLYPTVYEGFGLVPFEAAEAGTATVFASQAALAEILPESAATIVPWDAGETAERVAALLADSDLRDALVDTVKDASRRFVWDETAAGLLEAYADSVESPASPARSLWSAQGSLSPFLGSEDLKALVSSFPADVQRPLVALASRPAVRNAFFGTLRGLYATGYFVRRRRRPPPL
jgi:glycosyltransferase involved in cell wall biosynthesis/GT2 family glycosyltransferase